MVYAKRIGLAVGVLLLACLWPANVLADAGSIGGKPANPRPDNPRTQSIFVHEIAPGETAKDAITVTNNTSDKKTIELYATDAQIASGGAFACEQKADALDQEGAWVKLDESKVELEGLQSTTVPFTITVPKKISVGEHNACIAIQAVESPREGNTNGVRLSFRSAVRVAITVPGDFVKGLAFESLNVELDEKDRVAVHQKLRNSGNVSLDTNLETSLRTLFGNTLAKDGGEFPILAGQSAEFNFTFRKPVWGGWYRVTATAAYDNSKDTSLGEKGSSRDTKRMSSWVFVVPHPAAALLYLVLLAGIAGAVIFWQRKKRQMAAWQSASLVHTVAKGEDITAVSQQYDADWKQTARFNRLKPPYTLQEGQKLSVAPGPNYVPAKEKPKASAKKASKPKSKGKAAPRKTPTKRKATKSATKDQT